MPVVSPSLLHGVCDACSCLSTLARRAYGLDKRMVVLLATPILTPGDARLATPSRRTTPERGRLKSAMRWWARVTSSGPPPLFPVSARVDEAEVGAEVDAIGGAWRAIRGAHPRLVGRARRRVVLPFLARDCCWAAQLGKRLLRCLVGGDVGARV